MKVTANILKISRISSLIPNIMPIVLQNNGICEVCGLSYVVLSRFNVVLGIAY